MRFVHFCSVVFGPYPNLIKDYGPGNERRDCLWLAQSEDI